MLSRRARPKDLETGTSTNSADKAPRLTGAPEQLEDLYRGPPIDELINGILPPPRPHQHPQLALNDLAMHAYEAAIAVVLDPGKVGFIHELGKVLLGLRESDLRCCKDLSDGSVLYCSKHLTDGPQFEIIMGITAAVVRFVCHGGTEYRGHRSDEETLPIKSTDEIDEEIEPILPTGEREKSIDKTKSTSDPELDRLRYLLNRLWGFQHPFTQGKLLVRLDGSAKLLEQIELLRKEVAAMKTSTDPAGLPRKEINRNVPCKAAEFLLALRQNIKAETYSDAERDSTEKFFEQKTVTLLRCLKTYGFEPENISFRRFSFLNRLNVLHYESALEILDFEFSMDPTLVLRDDKITEMRLLLRYYSIDSNPLYA